VSVIWKDEDNFEPGLEKLRLQHADLEIDPTKLTIYQFRHELLAFDVMKEL